MHRNNRILMKRNVRNSREEKAMFEQNIRFDRLINVEHAFVMFHLTLELILDLNNDLVHSTMFLMMDNRE